MPSATGQGRIEYGDFRGGEYGTQDGSKVASNSFKAMNMIVTADGCLIPRPGLSDHTPADMPSGKVVGLAPTSTPGADMLFIVANKVYTYNKNDGTNLTEIGTLDVTPTKAIHPKQGTTEFYITIPTDKCYKLDPVAGTIDPYDDSPGGSEVELYGQRLVVADADQPYRIQFSDPADFDTWPAENFIDIGDFWQITSMREQRNYLAIMKREGYYILSGVLGSSNTTVRQVSTDRGPLHPGQVSIDFSDVIHLISAFHLNPATFDTTNVDQLSYLEVLGTVRDGDASLPLVIGSAHSQGKGTPSTVLFTQGGEANKMLLNHNGVWTQHETSVDITGMVRGGETGDFWLTDGGDTGVDGKIYSVQFTEDRPAFTTDTFVQPGDDSATPVNAWITFPQYWVPGSRNAKGATEINVRQVIVDFWKYNTGASATNHFDIAVDMLGRYPANTGDAPTNTYEWDEAGTVAGASIGDSRRDRVVHGFKSAKAGGFEVSLRNIRGVKIRQITVVFDVDDTRPPH